MGFDSSIGVSQVKVSTAKMLQEKGYMPESTTSIFEILCCIRKNEKIAIELGENKINIQYAAAYIKYMKEEWAEVYPEIETDIGIQATLYNLGHEKLRKGFVGRILEILSEGFKDERSPHANPTENDFGNEVLGVYALMEELLNEGNCNN